MTCPDCTKLHQRIERLERQLALMRGKGYNGPELMTRAELSKCLGLPSESIRAWTWRYDDFPKPMKLGEGWPRMWLRNEIDAWLQRHPRVLKYPRERLPPRGAG
jgi:predicted DNA-binding transcriptional regulator AlpA